jgi:lysophospholipase L1-like esterase
MALRRERVPQSRNRRVLMRTDPTGFCTFVCAPILWLGAALADTPGVCGNAVAVGESITAGYGVSEAYPAKIANTLGTSLSNQGVSGDGWKYDRGDGNLTSLAATKVDPLLSSLRCANGLPPLLILFAGANDMWHGGYTPAQTYSFFEAYLSDRISAGWNPRNMVVVTMLPIPARYVSKVNWQAYNSMLVSGQSTYKYVVAYTINDPNIGCFGCNNDQLYYNQDKVHLTDAGQQTLAKIICNAFNARGEYGSCPQEGESRPGGK